MKLKHLFEEIVAELGSTHGFGDKVLTRIEKALNIKATKFVRGGTRSDVFDIGSGKYLKITDDPMDAAGFMVGKAHPDYPIPKVFDIYKLKGVRGNLWMIISQKVETGFEPGSSGMEMRSWFIQNTKFRANDTHPGNIGTDSTGRKVYLDPSFDNADEYLSKIPVLKI